MPKYITAAQAAELASAEKAQKAALDSAEKAKRNAVLAYNAAVVTWREATAARTKALAVLNPEVEDSRTAMYKAKAAANLLGAHIR